MASVGRLCISSNWGSKLRLDATENSGVQTTSHRELPIRDNKSPRLTEAGLGQLSQRSNKQIQNFTTCCALFYLYHVIIEVNDRVNLCKR